jgi:hypothetical protein
MVVILVPEEEVEEPQAPSSDTSPSAKVSGRT